MASLEASWEIDSKASFPQAPYDSTTNGTQTQSSSLHLVSLDECFLSSVISAATPVVTLASKRVVGLSGDVTDRYYYYYYYFNSTGNNTHIHQ